MLDRIEFVLGEAFVALRRNGWMTFAAVTTAAMAIFLLAGLSMVYFGIARAADEAGKRLTLRVFLRDTVPDARAAALEGRLRSVPGVSSVRFIPRDEGLKEFQKKNPGIDVTGLHEQNPLPNTYHVSVRSQDEFEGVVAQIRRLDEVEPDGVKYPTDVQDFLRDVQRSVPVVGLTLGAVMLATAGILIYNAIRMTVVARRKEVSIMLLVGARRPTVWAPMVLEGLIQGLFGGTLAALIMVGLHSLVSRILLERMGPQAALPEIGLWNVVLALGLLGAFYGTICSIVAVREPWRQGGLA